MKITNLQVEAIFSDAVVQELASNDDRIKRPALLHASQGAHKEYRPAHWPENKLNQTSL